MTLKMRIWYKTVLGATEKKVKTVSTEREKSEPERKECEEASPGRKDPQGCEKSREERAAGQYSFSEEKSTETPSCLSKENNARGERCLSFTSLFQSVPPSGFI